MISPHLLKVVESFSAGLKSLKMAQEVANQLWGERPTFVIESQGKKPTWCHMIMARGPAMQPESETVSDDSIGSELVVIWWSEIEPETSRVLSAVDWDKHARNYP